MAEAVSDGSHHHDIEGSVGAPDNGIHIRKKLNSATDASSSAGGFICKYSKEAQIIRTAKLLRFTMDDLKQISFEEFMEVCDMATENTKDSDSTVRNATQADINAFKYS